MRQLLRSTSKLGWGTAVGESCHTSTFGREPPKLTANKWAQCVGPRGIGLMESRCGDFKHAASSCFLSLLAPCYLLVSVYTLEMHTHKHTPQSIPSRVPKRGAHESRRCLVCKIGWDPDIQKDASPWVGAPSWEPAFSYLHTEVMIRSFKFIKNLSFLSFHLKD